MSNKEKENDKLRVTGFGLRNTIQRKIEEIFTPGVVQICHSFRILISFLH